jgi:hypothetical protein
MTVSRRAIITAVAGALAAGALGVGASLLASSSLPAQTPSSTSASATPGGLNSASAAPSSSKMAVVSSPSTQAQQSANDPGDGVARDSPVPSPTAKAGDGRIRVQVVLTRSGVSDGALEAGAGVDGIVEAGGAATCTVTASRGTVTRSASGAAHRSAQSMDCGDGLSIPVSQLSSGTWTVQVRYSSSRYVGTSDSQEVQVQ